MRTVAELYDNYYDAKAAVQALESAGVPSDQISIVTKKENGVDVEGQGSYAGEGAGTGAGVGAVAGGAGGLLASLGMLAIPGVGAVVAAGWLAATAAGAVAGAVAGGAVGGIVGAMVRAGIPEDEANLYAEGLRRGGSVVPQRLKMIKWPRFTRFSIDLIRLTSTCVDQVTLSKAGANLMKRPTLIHASRSNKIVNAIA